MDKKAKKTVSERRKKIRKRRLFIAFVSLILISLVALAVMCFTVFFPIKEISAGGSKIYTKQEIINAVGIAQGDNLFTISTSKIDMQIRKQLPYVDSIKIKRQFPDGIKIIVSDAKEKMCYNLSGKYYVISENGYVLSESEEVPQNVFEIIGTDVTCSVGEMVIFKDEKAKELISSMIDALNDKDIKINWINVENKLNITAGVEGKFEVVFGTNENIEQKIAHLSGMIESIGERIGTIDLSMWSADNSIGTFVDSQK